MAEKSDVDFTFDTTGFKNGLKAIGGGIADVTRNTANMAKNVSQGVINAVAKIGLLGIAFKGVKSAISQIPEIGKTFSIAKDIIMKNFLFPIRKALFPVLQKLLNWVRDNRAMFVKWGQVLVNVFTVISKAVERVIDIGKGLLRTFGDFFNKTFGTQIKGMTDLLNIISFKFAVAIEFLSRLLKPIMDLIKPIIETLVENIGQIAEPIMKIAGHIIDIVSGLFDMKNDGSSLVNIFTDIMNFVGGAATFVAEMVESFITGLKPYIKPIAETVGEIAGYFKSMYNSIFGSNESIKGWKEIFKFIGNVVGTTILATFKTIGNIVKTIDSSIKSIKEVSDLLTGKEVSKDLSKNIGDTIAGVYDFLNPAQAQIRKAKEEKVKDAIIKPDGSVIRTDPADYIIATKTPGSMSKGGSTIHIDFSGMNINIQQATQEEAVRFGQTIVDQIRMQLNTELERMGA